MTKNKEAVEPLKMSIVVGVFEPNPKALVTQSVGAAEYTECISAEG